MRAAEVIRTGRKEQMVQETLEELDPGERDRSGYGMRELAVYPAIRKQQITGIGGAFTEAGADALSVLGPEARQKALGLYFRHDGGAGYTLARTHIQSCDFSLSNYAYVPDGWRKGDPGFSIARDEGTLIPMIRTAQEMAPGLRLLASPWSPPGYMKTNGEMNHGGTLRDDYADDWAALIVQYLLAYRKAGIRIGRITVQNEPEAVQTWDSCVYSGSAEGAFLAGHLRPALDAAGLQDVGVLIWDHNADVMVERVHETFSVSGAEDAAAGIAYHWYAGDHFEAVREMREEYPGKEILFTEGCVEYSRFDAGNEGQHAEMYGHALIGAFNAGANGFIDWNMFLDDAGGPNHVGNYCGAPVMIDRASGEISIRLPYYYISHFSRYVMPGAARILSSSYTDRLESAAFQNPDGSIAVICLNRTDTALPVALALKQAGRERNPEVWDLSIPAHSIITVLV